MTYNPHKPLGIEQLMTFNEYMPLAVRTLNHLGLRRNDLAHMGLGLGSEYLEFQLVLAGDKSDTIPAELGDLCWFTASMMHLLKIEYAQGKYEEHKHIITNNTILQDVGGIVDTIKKHFAYHIPILDQERWLDKIRIKWREFRKQKYIKVGQLDYQLHIMVQNIRHLCNVHDQDFELVLIGNIEKLRKRYPEGYSDYHAAERFDKKESKKSDT